MTSHARGIAIPVLLGLATGAYSAETSGLPNAHRLAANPMVCRIDPAKVVRSIPRALFGTNLEWFNSANGISNDDGTVASGWVTVAKQQGIDNVRFPGGTLSDFYQWRDGTGPQASRPIVEHPTDSGRSRNAFGTPEFLRFCSAIGASPLITVNAGTGTAEDAAAWVAYCNQAGNAARVADGLVSPAGVKLWEIGNELYLPGNPGDKKIITTPPAVYADRFLSFAKAMRKVDPSIKLIAIGTANSSPLSLPFPEWNDVVLRKAAAEADYYAVHNSYFPMTFGQPGTPLRDLYQSLWAAPEAIDRSLSKLSTLIAKYEGSRHVEIAVTEWGALFSYDKDEMDLVKTMGTSVYLARVMQVYLGQPRVSLANYFKFTDRTFMGWVGYDRKPKVPYYVIQLFTQHFGTRLVAASIESPTFDSKAVGVAGAEKKVPELTVVASLDDSGKKLFVNIVNRSWNTRHQVTLDTASFSPKETAKTWAISAPGLTDHNGKDLPAEIDAALYSEPKVNKALRGTIGVSAGTWNPKKPITVPPYSILTVELESSK